MIRDRDGALTGNELAGIAIPLQMMLHPFEPVTGAQQGEVKGRMTRRLGREGLRGHGAELPACFGSARHRLISGPHHENGNAGCLGRQGEATARGQIIGFRPAPEFDDHRAQCGTARPFKSGLQGGYRIEGPDKDGRRGRQAQFHKPAGIRQAGFPILLACTDPEHGLVFPARSQHQRKAGETDGIRLSGGMNFMQCPGRERKTALVAGPRLRRPLKGERHILTPNVLDMF